MPEDKSDFRIVGEEVVGGVPPPALRVLKTVRGRDESLYTFLLPGVVPDPLKLSIHPTGEIQLKSRRAGLITRIDREKLLRGLQPGEFDRAFAKFLSPSLMHEAAEGFIAGPNAIPDSTPVLDQPLHDTNVTAGQLLAVLTKVQVDDISELPEVIAALREQGRLPSRATLHLVTRTSDKPIIFLSILDRPLEGVPDTFPIPEGFPFPRVFRALVDSLRLYGGLLFVMPDEADARELAKAAGMENLFDGLARFAEALDDPAVERDVGRVMGQIAVSFAGPIRRVVRAKPLRPLRTPTRTHPRPSPPPGGWLRRRPRRRGHTAPLVSAR
jgi:hypothetical protein